MKLVGRNNVLEVGDSQGSVTKSFQDYVKFTRELLFYTAYQHKSFVPQLFYADFQKNSLKLKYVDG